MNPQIQDKINALLLLCFEVTAEGVWDLHFSFDGHCNVITVRATNADHDWQRENLPLLKYAFPSLWLALYQHDHIGETDEEHIARVNEELDAAIALVQGLRNTEVSHAA
jgi:hypothetical protein